MQIHDHQNGFVQDKSTNDGIFLLKRSQSLEQTGSHYLLHLLTAERLLTNYVERQCLSAYERVFHLTRTYHGWIFSSISTVELAADSRRLDLQQHSPQLVVRGREGPRGQYYFHSCWTYACEILWNAHGLSTLIFSHTVTELTRWGGVVLSTA